jgi:hypothetical protein
MATLIDGIPVQDGMTGQVDEAAYHADRGSLSVSGAKLLLPPSCPAKFRERMDNPPKPKREYDFGHVAHKLILKEGAEVVVVDATDWRTKDAREARDAAHAEGKTPILAAEFEKAEAMAAAVRSHSVAGPLFERGYAEKSLYHTDPGTGVRLRGRTDWLTLVQRGDREVLTVVDLKTSTTANPAELERKFWQFGYFMQAAHYLDLVTAIGLSDAPAFRFVVVEKEPPHIVTVIQYDDEAIAEGRRLMRMAIATYVQCRDSGIWPGYADDTVVSISLPRWAAYDGVKAAAEALITELEGISA